MDIAPQTLAAQARAALAGWPFIPDVERFYRLSPFTLFGYGSRETNLTNEVGDGGHGHGVWQYDDRSHTIPAGFDQDVLEQAQTAAGMVAGLVGYYGGDQHLAACAYNSGVGAVDSHRANPDAVTTGGDYGVDVLARIAWLQANVSYPPAQGGAVGYGTASDPISGGEWVVTPDGGVQTFDGAPYLGGLNSHPEWHADPPAGIAYWRGGDTPTTGQGYAIVTVCDDHGVTHIYRFRRSGADKTEEVASAEA